MQNRQEHQQEVLAFLRGQFPVRDWAFSLPHGTGMEKYVARSNDQQYFIKVGVPVARYLALAEIGLTPPVLAHGELESGVSIIVQPFIEGYEPSRADYRNYLREAAELVREMHTHPRIRETLPAAPSNSFRDAGLQALTHLRQKWECYRAQVPSVANFVDNSLDEIEQQINRFSGEGLVASHGDICNANWLFTPKGKIYILDLESMCMDDPAADMGALLWWYYPPELREQFLDVAGYSYNEEFKFRMCVRMAMHCLHILLPRENSFDHFEPERFGEWLEDFRALMNGEENPQGYD
jgi:thiamine kinase-like enzyme